MKITIRYTKGKEESYQTINSSDYAKAKARLERLGYKVEKVK